MNGAENAIPMRSTSSRLGLFAALAAVGCASAEVAETRELTLSEVAGIGRA